MLFNSREVRWDRVCNTNLSKEDTSHWVGLCFTGYKVLHMLIWDGLINKKSNWGESCSHPPALGAVVMLGVKHFILSVWGLSKIRELGNHGWELFLSLMMKANSLVMWELRAFLSVPFPLSRLPGRELFYQRMPSVCPRAAISLIEWAPSNPFLPPYQIGPQPVFSLLLFAYYIERVILLKGDGQNSKLKYRIQDV